MITYRSKKHPDILVTSDGEVDPKYKTVLITFSNGKTQSISSPTLASQWEIIENPAPTPEKIPESESRDATSIGYSIAEFAENVAQTMGGKLKTWESKPNILAITYGNKSVMEICVSKRYFKVRVKPEVLRSDEEYVAHSYNFGATITFEYDDTGYSALESLITRSIVYSSNKPKKTRKTTKEEQKHG